ncbi:hypothetical protein K458DRAFT_451235 [Lentithecium fluviatile CBS 122367]|uniref:Uncharacterized protein n=1 Tax=Lentithecium fluviatile CBS 122367 TaxID=1168545 RepID=A0A6G1J1H3_9PLEO|nr:hypothetical protein K458DRAFT_451235 [Lentithecium fluviatile CBS 122367]
MPVSVRSASSFMFLAKSCITRSMVHLLAHSGSWPPEPRDRVPLACLDAGGSPLMTVSLRGLICEAVQYRTFMRLPLLASTMAHRHLTKRPAVSPDVPPTSYTAARKKQEHRAAVRLPSDESRVLGERMYAPRACWRRKTYDVFASTALQSLAISQRPRGQYGQLPRTNLGGGYAAHGGRTLEVQSQILSTPPSLLERAQEVHAGRGGRRRAVSVSMSVCVFQSRSTGLTECCYGRVQACQARGAIPPRRYTTLTIRDGFRWLPIPTFDGCELQRQRQQGMPPRSVTRHCSGTPPLMQRCRSAHGRARNRRAAECCERSSQCRNPEGRLVGAIEGNQAVSVMTYRFCTARLCTVEASTTQRQTEGHLRPPLLVR